MFGSCYHISAWRVHHDDTLLGCCRNIDIVQSNAGTAHNLQVGSRLYNLRSHFGGTSNHQRVIFMDDAFKLIRRQPCLDIHLDSLFLLKHFDADFTQIITDQYFHYVLP